MFLLVDRCLDHLRMEGVGNERDDKRVLADLAFEGIIVGDVERDRSGMSQAFA